MSNRELKGMMSRLWEDVKCETEPMVYVSLMLLLFALPYTYFPMVIPCLFMCSFFMLFVNQ